MIKTSFLLAAVVLAGATAANADTITTLPQVNGTYGAGVATTTTDATGIRTTVVGPGGGNNRANATPVANQWIQANVGGGATVGITTDYANSGNGSAYFSTTSGDGKADLQYYFSAPVALSSLSTISFDFLRDAASTTGGNFAPALRLDIRKDGAFAGSLVFEYLYQNQTQPIPGQWTSLTGGLNSGIFWATNAALGPTFADANGGQKTLQSWINANAGTNLTVTGLSFGVGSGWNDSFKGAVDNVNVAFTGGQTYNANFEVAAGAVPEPTTWAMLIGGFGMMGGAMRRRSVGKVAIA